MPTIFIFSLIYIVGCLVCYARLNASFYEIDEDFNIESSLKQKTALLIFSLLSWLGFIGGVMNFFEYKERYFFKIGFYKES